jgi:uncharacterized membrane protein YhhN
VGVVGVLLMVTAVVVVLDWVAVGTGRARLEAVAKPAVMLGLIAVAVAVLLAGPDDGAASLSPTVRVGVLVGLLAGLAGDVLLLPQVDRFVPGLVAFLVGHLGYSAAFLGHGLRTGATLVGASAAVGLVVAVGLPILHAVRRSRPALVVPVGCYLVVTGLVVTVAIGSGPAAARVGAVLFAGSDAVLGWARFVRPVPGGRLLVMVPYHLGQALIVLGLLR